LTIATSSIASATLIWLACGAFLLAVLPKNACAAASTPYAPRPNGTVFR
jgi:hypothetical protein